MSDELKPCPFCGVVPKVYTSHIDDHRHLRHTHPKCYMTNGWELLDDWNHRPGEDALRGELAEARAENARLRSEQGALRACVMDCECLATKFKGEPQERELYALEQICRLCNEVLPPALEETK